MMNQALLLCNCAGSDALNVNSEKHLKTKMPTIYPFLEWSHFKMKVVNTKSEENIEEKASHLHRLLGLH